MKTPLKSLALGAGFAIAATTVQAADTYVLDPSHSQIVFSYNHFGYSTSFGMFSGFTGEILFDQENPSESAVTIAIPVMSMFTGWEQRTGHLLSPDFFNGKEGDLVTFTSTGVEVTGEDTGLITGTLVINGMEKEVVLDARLNGTGTHPLAQKDWAGFDATATLLRSEFGLGAYAPAISDEVQVRISIEAEKAE